MTPKENLRVIGPDGHIKYMPSIWVIEEKAMALAMSKRFRLLIDVDVHEEAWKAVNAETVHYLFNEKSFNVRVDKVLDVLDKEFKDHIWEMVSAEQEG